MKHRCFFWKLLVGMIVCVIPIKTVSESENFTIQKTNKKKDLKKTGQDCCQEILQGMKCFARTDQRRGQLKELELGYSQDFFEDNTDAIFKLADQKQLQQLYRCFEKANILEHKYEQGLIAIYNEVKQLEQDILGKKK
jgi:hypothetical protein